MPVKKFNFDEATVIAMRKRAVEGALAKQLAWEFGVSRETARDITTGRTYAHFGGPLQRRKYTFVSEAESRQIGLFVALGNSMRRASKVFGRSPAVVARHAAKYREKHGLTDRRKDHETPRKPL
jgi:transposase